MEIRHQADKTTISKILSRRIFDIFTKLGAISIDGFNRESYIIKIDHLKNEVVKARNELLEKESEIE